MSEWFLDALVALLCWGLWAYFPKLAVRHIPPGSALVFEALGILLVGGAAAAWIGRGLQYDPRGAVPAVLTGVFGGIGLYFFFGAARSGPISLVAPLTALYPLVTLVLAVLFLGERLSWQQGLGVALAVAAGVLLSWKGF
ncbi:EamA family transporter [Dissulfurirhabdus thermomarina]|uniref:EamA family transporter n=1 Tax=Dissulfurirhabdus thermomarina TaxID=1765737 RepID=A0A6N9TQQ3_DISTH|nr:EamA family transporter [Dissulfurirhabdus thermomarina]NDY42054.1 EamA family transporter [Dissulfurirhabdus thermomarina]NMX24528.1 EamA family transporter [Dissulfurirhabdus thermomarina]